MPRVSVIIPTCNRAAVIRRALDSVFAQTYRDLEAIVVDEEPGDGTERLINGYPNVVYVKKRCGMPSVARNVGIGMATGEYLAFLDSDDTWAPEKLERQVAILDGQREVGFVCSNALVAGSDNKKLRDGQGKSGYILDDLIDGNFVVTSSVVARRSLIEEIGGFPEDPRLRVGEDFDTWLRAAAISRCQYIPDALVTYSAGSGISSGETEESYMRYMLVIYERLRRFLKSRGCRDGLAFSKIGRTSAAFRFNLNRSSGNYLYAALWVPRWAPYRLATALYGLAGRARR